MVKKNFANFIKLICLFPALLFLGACSSSSSSDPAPAAGGQWLYIADGQDTFNGMLYAVNYGSGAIKIIGPLRDTNGDGYSVSALATADDGTLYGFTGNDSRQFVSIDTTTAVVTVIGATDTVPDAEFMGGVLYAWTENSDDVGTVDLGTGVVTALGDSNISSWGTGLAASGGVLYVVNGDDQNVGGSGNGGATIWSLDTTTGLPTEVVTDIASVNNNLVTCGSTTYNIPVTGVLGTLNMTTGVGAARWDVSQLIRRPDAIACATAPSLPSLKLYIAGGGGSPGVLSTFDLHTGVMKSVGGVRLANGNGLCITGLAHVGNTLYGATCDGSYAMLQRSLVTISKSSGVATVVGPLVDGGAAPVQLSALASDGITLYGWGANSSGSGAYDLHTVDPATGVTTIVGSSGGWFTGLGFMTVGGTTELMASMAYDLFTIDTGTGADTYDRTLGGELDMMGNGNIWGFNAMDCGPFLVGMEQGNLYGSNGPTEGINPGLGLLDPNNSYFTRIANAPRGNDALACGT